MKPAHTIAWIALLSTGRAAAQTAPIVPGSHIRTQNDLASQNKQQVRTLYEACLNKRNYDGLRDVVSEDYTGIGGERGPAGLIATVQPLIAAFPDIRWTIEDLLADGDKVIVRWHWEGTHTGVFRGFAGSGKKITNSAIAIYQFSGGKAVRAWMESDRLGFMTQIGAIPAALLPPPPGGKN